MPSKHTEFETRTNVSIHEYGDSIYLEEEHRQSTESREYLEDGTTVVTRSTDSIYIETPILKNKSDEEKLVFGWANISVEADGTVPLDWQGDITAPAVLEKAAYNFVLKHRTTGEMHQGGVVGHLVESVMFTKQKQESMGIPEGVMPEGWWVGFYVPDEEVVAKIKSGEYKMFSIQGKAKRLSI